METLTFEFVNQCLNYCPESGSLTWKDRPREHFKTKRGWSVFKSQFKGNDAGTVNKQGYLQVCISHKLYRSHRIGWLLSTGKWPIHQIDHINNNRVDNRLCNLREATNTENSMNSGLRADNSSGIKGVSWNKRIQKWHARIYANKKFNHLGYFETTDEAKTTIQSHRKLHHGEFAHHG